jgi:hypothetical protein
VNRMRRLWSSQKEPPHSMLRFPHSRDERPFMEDYDPNPYLKQLYLMEHACTRLHSLDMTVQQDIGSQEAIVERLLKFFTRYNKLEHLRLVFGKLAFGELLFGHDRLGRDSSATSRLFKGLVNLFYWNELHDLELELITEESTLVQFVW